MYEHCLRCGRSFPSNHALAALPLGRRIAWHQDTGRVWVVCSPCGQWNLVPFEERWEILEQCDQLTRKSQVRAGTSSVGLARTDDVELIRLGGKPLSEDLANWRYGRRLIHRHRRTVAAVAATTLAGAAAVGWLLPRVSLSLADSWVPLAWCAVVIGSWILADPEDRPLWAVRQSFIGRLLRTYTRHVNVASLEVRPGRRHSPSVTVVVGGVEQRYHGRDALLALFHLLPRANRRSASVSEIKAAVALVDAAETEARRPGSPLAPWERIVARGARGKIRSLPWTHRLALEMAVTEAVEQEALRGAAEALSDPARDAEAIGAIADDLLMPSFATEWVAKHRPDPEETRNAGGRAAGVRHRRPKPRP